MATPSGPLGMSEPTGPRSACGVPALGRSARQPTARTTAVTRPKDARGCIARRIVSRFVAGRQFGLAAATFRLRHTSQSLAPRPPPIAGAVPVSAEVIHVPLAADVALRRERARRTAAARRPSGFGARRASPRPARDVRFHGVRAGGTGDRQRLGVVLAAAAVRDPHADTDARADADAADAPGARPARAGAPQPRRGLARDGLRRLRRVPRRAA